MAPTQVATPATTRKAVEDAASTANAANERAAHLSNRMSVLRDDVEQLKKAVTELQEVVVAMRRDIANG